MYDIDFEILKASRSAVTFDNEDDALMFYKIFIERFPEKNGSWTEEKVLNRYKDDSSFTFNTSCLLPNARSYLKYCDMNYYINEGYKVYHFDEICSMKNYDCDMSDGILDLLF